MKNVSMFHEELHFNCSSVLLRYILMKNMLRLNVCPETGIPRVICQGSIEQIGILISVVAGKESNNGLMGQ